MVDGFDPSANVSIILITIFHELVELLVLFLLHGFSILIIFFYYLVRNNSLILLELVGKFLKLMVQMVDFLLDVAIPVPEFEFGDEFWKLLVQFHRLFKVLLVDFLSQMLVKLALLYYLFVYLGF